MLLNCSNESVFDTCSLHRPLDDKAQLRVALEAEAVLGLLARCEGNEWTLVSSDVLSLEVDRNPHPDRKAYVSAILAKAQSVAIVDEQCAERARGLEARSFKAFDALHIAAAESGGADYLCSCDDRLLRKARQQTDLAVRVVSPLELAKEVSS